MALSYNSQNWRRDGSTTYKLGADVGYGFGWRLMAGSLTPIYSSPTTFLHYLFTDASGAEYKLDVNTGGVWSSKEGIYVSFNTNTNRLQFSDGSTWLMDCVAGANEQDSGTRYPTQMRDRHGNFVTINYRPQVGGSTINTSARIQSIDDARSTAGSGWITYSFTYNADAISHLTGITNNIRNGSSFPLQIPLETRAAVGQAKAEEVGALVHGKGEVGANHIDEVLLAGLAHRFELSLTLCLFAGRL